MRCKFLKSKATFMIFIIVCVIFTINLIKPVSAQVGNACCEKTTTKNYCIYTLQSNCDPNFQIASFQPCDETSFCKLGCCISPDGTCSKSVGQANCASHLGYVWTEQKNCDMPECDEGCCVLAESQCAMTTEKKCDNIMKSYPELEKDFRYVSSESECVEICRASDKGCCVELSGKCEYTTKGMCAIPQINPTTGTGFYKDIYCSKPALNDKAGAGKVRCGCDPESEKRCVEDSDDVYHFDTCGNQEEMAEDCHYTSGTLCGTDETEEEPYCKSTNCEGQTYSDERNVHDGRMGGPRWDGEAWCVYDGPAGNWLDYPGSRHYRHICINGEEIVEPCRDYRQEICVQAPLYKAGRTGAACITHEIYSSPFNTSVSTVPIGGRFWEPETMTECDKGHGEKGGPKCTVYEVKKRRHFADWKCEENCECFEQGFTDDLAMYCKSLGDCGADYNSLGDKTTDGFQMYGPTNAPTESGKSIKEHFSESLWDEWGEHGVFGGMRGLSTAMESVLAEDPGIDTSAMHPGWLLASMITTTVLLILTPIIVGVGVFLATGAGVGIAVSSFLALKGIAGGFIKGATAACGAGPHACAVAIVIVVVIIAIMFLVTWILGGAKVKEYEVWASCTAWQPPTGGAKCTKCDLPKKDGGVLPDIDGIIIPGYTCSEYKCMSLGQNCKFISENEGSGRETCYNADIGDVNPPKISDWDDPLTEGYTLDPARNGYKIDQEVKPYHMLTFGIETDELAQCKIETKHTNNYEEMTHYFGMSPYYLKEHNMSINPNPDEEYHYYVRCQDPSGNSNVEEYEIFFKTESGPDITVPSIESTSLQNGAFIQAGTDLTALVVYLNEPSDCKWSFTDEDYLLMPNNLSCGDTPFPGETGPPSHASPYFFEFYNCMAALNVSLGLNTYYFRCQDVSENTNTESYQFTLVGTEVLIISQSAPEGVLYYNNVTLQVTTEDGAEAGFASCTLAGVPFYQTNSTYHEQKKYTIPRGRYSYNASCTDIAGNTASTMISFEIGIETSKPKILEIYTMSNNLYIVLNEDSSCEFSNQTFQFGQGYEMSGAGTKTHAANLIYDTFYIRCQDNYGNEAEEGEIIVHT